MTASKAHRQRRHRGCWVCGKRFIKDHSLSTALRHTCQECLEGRTLLLSITLDTFFLIVDGSFVPWNGERDARTNGAAGAGLVLVNSTTNEIVAKRSCGFEARHSNDAERQAVIRGARWIPGVVIYTDSEGMITKLRNETLRDIRFLPRPWRGLHTYGLAHQLSVQGRKQFQLLTMSGACDKTNERHDLPVSIA
jgi:hypothetical protein